MNAPVETFTNGRWELPPHARGVLVLADPPEAGWRLQSHSNAPIAPGPTRSKRLIRKSPLMAAGAVMLAAAAIAATGCGGGAKGPDNDGGPSRPQAFAWLRPSAPAPAWHLSPLPDGAARMAYPLRWRSIRSDPGTVSAAFRAESGEIRGYLNATPQQGAETLENWSSFRLDHNSDEGDVNVEQHAARTPLVRTLFCVIDTQPVNRARYREIVTAPASATT